MMKKTNQFIVSVFFLIILTLPFPFLQAQTIKNFKDTSCFIMAKPMVLRKGDKVFIGCDTAYLINATRYRLYEKARHYLMTLAGNTDKMAFNQMEGSMNQLDTYFTEIQSRYFLLSEEVKKTQTENRIILQEVNKELDQTRSELISTRKDLDFITQSLKKANRKTFTNRLIFGSIGLGLGLFLGAILIN